jgi:hypothetical protein
MNQEDAKRIIEQGITYAELRAILLTEFDGAASTTIRDFTKHDVQLLLRGCIGNRNGRVNAKTHSALVAQLVLREFAPDNN